MKIQELLFAIFVFQLMTGCDQNRGEQFVSREDSKQFIQKSFPDEKSELKQPEFIQLVDKKDVLYISEHQSLRIRGRYRSSISMDASELNSVLFHEKSIDPLVVILIFTNVKSEIGEINLPETVQELSIDYLEYPGTGSPIEMFALQNSNLQKMIISRTQLNPLTLKKIASIPTMIRLEIYDCPGIEQADIEMAQSLSPNLKIQFEE